MGLIDRLEALVSAGTRVPLTSKALVDEQDFLELVDQLRVAVPEEVRHAKRVSQERERVLSQARAEADKILATTQEQANQLVRDSEILRLAKEQADAILTAADEDSRRMRSDADSYAMSVLDGLEGELNRLTATVRKGKSALEAMAQDGNRTREAIPSHPSRTVRSDGNDSGV